jgi:hypothetical protein
VVRDGAPLERSRRGVRRLSPAETQAAVAGGALLTA